MTGDSHGHTRLMSNQGKVWDIREAYKKQRAKSGLNQVNWFIWWWSILKVVNN